MNHQFKIILVTGAHRSGTTFVGNILSTPINVSYIYEPFNKTYGLEGIDYWYTYIKRGMGNEIKYRQLMNDLFNLKAKYKTPKKEYDSFLKICLRKIYKSKGNIYYYRAKINPFKKFLLLKDPIACLSSEYLHREFNANVIILIRHPAGFVSSIKRLGWRFDFNNFTNQPHLIEDYLKDLLKNVNFENLSVVEEGALLWICIHKVLDSFIKRNPKFIVFRHEDIARDPKNVFQYLFKKLEINFNKKIIKKIQIYTSSNNLSEAKDNVGQQLRRNSKALLDIWKKRLSKNEIVKIREITESIASKYYSKEDW